MTCRVTVTLLFGALCVFRMCDADSDSSSSGCSSDDAALTHQTKDELDKFLRDSVSEEDLNEVLQRGAVGVHIHDQQVYFTHTEGIMHKKLLLFHDLVTSVLDTSWQGLSCDPIPNVSLAVRFSPPSKAEVESFTDSDNAETAAGMAVQVARAWAQGCALALSQRREPSGGAGHPSSTVPTFCFSRTKKGSSCILVPGPHYGDLQSWSKYTAKWQIAGRHHKFDRRKVPAPQQSPRSTSVHCTSNL
eukprot:9494817-Pyramimonas_sp.AAC.3